MQISKRRSQSSDRKIELLLKVKQCEHQIREEIRLVLSALFRVTDFSWTIREFLFGAVAMQIGYMYRSLPSCYVSYKKKKKKHNHIVEISANEL